jgi:hypothetical protein
METCFSETLVSPDESTRHQKPEEEQHHPHRSENLKFHKIKIYSVYEHVPAAELCGDKNVRPQCEAVARNSSGLPSIVCWTEGAFHSAAVGAYLK